MNNPEPKEFTRKQIIDALIAEHAFYLIECGYTEEGELSEDDYAKYLSTLSDDELVEETGTDANFTLGEFISGYG